MFIKQVAGIASLALGSAAHSYSHEIPNSILPQLPQDPLDLKYFSYVEPANVILEPIVLATPAAEITPSVEIYSTFDDTANIAADILRGVRQIISNTFDNVNLAVQGYNNLSPPPPPSPLGPEEPALSSEGPTIDDNDEYEQPAQISGELEKIPDWSTLSKFTPETMVELNRVQSLVASPGKKRAAFTFYKYTIDGDQEASNIRFFDIDEPENVRNATDFDIDSSDDEPVWLDESNIAFTAKRNNASETNIYVVNVDTGNQYQLTNFSTSVSGLIYSPTANVIAFTAPVFQGLGLEETAKTLESISSAPAHGKIYDTLYVRHWDTWLDGTKSQLFALPLTKRAGQYGVSGDPQNLVSSYPGSWGLEPYDYSFSKDGQTIVFAASIPGRDEAWSTRANVFTVPVHDDSQTQPFSLNSESIGGCSSPTFSPNGTYIAWLQMSRPNNGNDQNRIMLYSTVAAETKRLVPQWSLSPDNIQFSESGQHLLIVVEEEGDTRLYRLDVDSGNLEQLTTDGTVQMPIEIASGSMMFMYNTAQSPNEIMRMTINDSGVSTELISTFNTDTLSHVWMSPPTRFYFTGALGDRVQGVLYRPYGFNMSRTYPLAFIIHGGPYGSSGNHWSWRWNQDIFANQGFVVVEINFHGSTGFGQAFADAVRFQWGGHPFEDLMKGLNYVTRTYSFIDTNRMAALGASYGGYMITWMLGQTTPFKAYVCHDGEFSSYSTFFSTDEIGFDEHESGLPWDVYGMATYERWDPRRYVGRWNTPTLVIHGEKDYRLPVTEGISIFAALQRRGVPSRFLYFPDENHWVLRPANSLQWHAVVLDWISTYTNTESTDGDDQELPEAELDTDLSSESSEETPEDSSIEPLDDAASEFPTATTESDDELSIDSILESEDDNSDEPDDISAADGLDMPEPTVEDDLDSTEDTLSLPVDTETIDSINAAEFIEDDETTAESGSDFDGKSDDQAKAETLAGLDFTSATDETYSDEDAAEDLATPAGNDYGTVTETVILQLISSFGASGETGVEDHTESALSLDDISATHIQTVVPEIVSGMTEAAIAGSLETIVDTVDREDDSSDLGTALDDDAAEPVTNPATPNTGENTQLGDDSDITIETINPSDSSAMAEAASTDLLDMAKALVSNNVDGTTIRQAEPSDIESDIADDTVAASRATTSIVDITAMSMTVSSS